MSAGRGIAIAAGLLLSLGTSLAAQTERPVSIELRALAMTPTFSIADAANTGPGFGAGFGYRVSPKVRLMADLDAGFHPTPVTGFDINTYHLMGKVGLDVVRTDKVTVTLNTGAGLVRFGGDLPAAKSYFAINAGAKIGIRLADAVELLISPQGDIAFSKEADVGTSNAWVWPLGAGLRFRF
ncbi:MAG: outer membrane beta-barrel protein [Gemmatimonadales bacterium]